MTPEEAKAKLAAEKKKRLEEDAERTSFSLAFPLLDTMHIQVQPTAS